MLITLVNHPIICQQLRDCMSLNCFYGFVKSRLANWKVCSSAAEGLLSARHEPAVMTISTQLRSARDNRWFRALFLSAQSHLSPSAAFDKTAGVCMFLPHTYALSRCLFTKKSFGISLNCFTARLTDQNLVLSWFNVLDQVKRAINCHQFTPSCRCKLWKLVSAMA